MVLMQEMESGLCVSLSSFLGLSRQYLEMHYQKTKESFYLFIKKTKKVSQYIKIIICSEENYFPFQPPAPAPVVDEAPPSKKPTRLAIGVDGGFDGGVEKVEYEESYSLLVMPELTVIPLPDPQLPQKVGVWVAGVGRGVNRCRAL